MTFYRLNKTKDCPRTKYRLELRGITFNSDTLIMKNIKEKANRYQRRCTLLLETEKTARGPALCTFTATAISHFDVAVSHLVSSSSSSLFCRVSSSHPNSTTSSAL